MVFTRPVLALLLVLATTSLTIADRPDILVEDFEAESYGSWVVTGEAFGPGPAQGTLPNQQEVSGYKGERLVNSYFRGDQTTGTLTSPPFTIERHYLNFLIGGGYHPGGCELQLLIDGNIVKRATGNNDETLHWKSFDLQAHEGATAQIRIVDEVTGGWGHINVDHIVLSDAPRATPRISRTLQVTERYVHLPVAQQGQQRRMTFSIEGETVRQFDVILSETPDFWVASDVSMFQGQEITIDLRGESNPAMHLIRQADEMPGADRMYREKDRPQFHFTTQRGWLNDPNGLMYYDGEWHLYYQHNPYGWGWGNMHWGHAISTDLFHWREQGNVFRPFGEDTQGGAFSGGGLVDLHNTAGWQTGDDPVLIASFTDTGLGEVMAYSNDRGRTFTFYENNPVIVHQELGRDPKIIWHEPSQRWVLVVYERLEGVEYISFYNSTDLKQWTYLSRIGGFYECPDLFELPVDGNEHDTRWVLYAADAQYVIGHFDGREFHPEHEGKHRLWHGNYYAAQTYDNAPDGRRVQIGWARTDFPGMPFNQQMAIPVELSLRSTDEGPRLFAEPVPELQAIRSRTHRIGALELSPGAPNPLEHVHSQLSEVDITFRPQPGARVVFNLAGVLVSYDSQSQVLNSSGLEVPLAPVNGEVRLQILVDRGSVEVFGNSGQVAVTQGARPTQDGVALHVRTEHAPVSISELRVSELRSVWP